jgi:diaminopimelate decarboxylase/siderophore synthetase component
MTPFAPTNEIEGLIQRLRAERDEPLCAYIYDLRRLQAHVSRLVAGLPAPCQLYYAIKANAEAPILRALAPIVDGFEAASLGEVDKIRAVCPASPILLGGPAKTDTELAGAIHQRARLIHVESTNELERLELIASRLGAVVPILLRVNLAAPLPAATLQMAGVPTQFGIEQAQVPAAVSRAGRCPHLDLQGFHFHSISNNLDAEAHVRLIITYLELAQAWSRELGLSVSRINVGGGIGVNYADPERQFDWATFTSRLQVALREHCPAGWRLLFECGRYLTAECGFYAAEVLDLKTNHGKHYAIIRGGAHHFRLPVAWQHSHPVAVIPIETWRYPFARPELRDRNITVAGELCTPKDVLARDVAVSRVRMGDVALFPYAGAYGWAISHHDFLSHPHPEQVFLRPNDDLDGHATTSILGDLVDSLLYENLFGMGEPGLPAAGAPEAAGIPGFDLREDELYVRLPLGAQDLLLFRVHPRSWLLPYRLSRPPVLRVTTGEGGRRWQVLGPVEVMDALAGRTAWPNLAGFLRDLQDAVAISRASLSAARRLDDETAADKRPALLIWEQIAALRDRPFHPTARAKTGWSPRDHRRFAPELGNPFGLDWVALRRDVVRSSRPAAGQEIADAVLDVSARQRLAGAFAERGLGSADHLALPVHPWQLDHGLPTLVPGEQGLRVAVPLARDLGAFCATSSLRTLSRPHAPGLDLKLPLAVQSLGALRLLTLRKLENGQRAQQLLQRLVALDPLLARRLHFCDETRWWIFCPPGADPFDDRLGHLACQLRAYPSALIADQETDLVPMAALASLTASGRVPAAEYLLRSRQGDRRGPAEVLSLFAEICQRFTEVVLTCFRHGVMPEIHGQNVLLVVRAGQVDGLLLRDHDSVRVHPSWMARSDLPAPGYLLNPDTPNSLVNETPEELLAYFQTLGVQVNLYAIAVALARSHGIGEERFGQAIGHAISSAIGGLDLPRSVRDLLRAELLERESWPIKQVISPLLLAGGPATLGMPSGWARTRNPLHTRRAPR